jgi:hypothetical protein
MSDQEIDRDDPRFNQGVLHTVDLLAKALNAKDWVAGDGSEDYDEDLQQTLINILAAAGLYDTETGDYASGGLVLAGRLSRRQGARRARCRRRRQGAPPHGFNCGRAGALGRGD